MTGFKDLIKTLPNIQDGVFLSKCEQHEVFSQKMLS